MKIRAVMVIRGTVQNIGFRDRIKKLAKMLELSGQAENTGRNSVRIICEGEENDIKELGLRLRPTNGLSKVNRVHIEHGKAEGNFRGFKIIREKNFEKAVFVKLDNGVRHLKGIKSELGRINSNIAGVKSGVAGVKGGITGLKSGIAGVKTEVGGLKSEVIRGNGAVRSSIRTMDSHIGGHFHRLDKKYDRFGDKLDDIHKDMIGLRGDIGGIRTDMREILVKAVGIEATDSVPVRGKRKPSPASFAGA